MAAATREAEKARRSISCGPGCGACCRQLVPVAEAEALYLRAVVENLGPDRRARIQARHRGAMRKIRHSGLLQPLRSANDPNSRDRRRELGLRYFRLGIPCPFLEQESCSIHPHRPLACREYLVTSDPKHCAAPDVGRVETLELPRRPSSLLYRFGDGDGSAPARWPPLPLAKEWAESSEAQATQDVFAAPSLFERFLHRFAGAEVQDSGSPGSSRG